MGLFDTVYCQAKIPDADLGPEAEFQTYSLGRGMSRYTITTAGRLLTYPVQIRLSPVDLEYHGDLLLHPTCGQAGIHEYVARFTEGKLEWIRPVADVSDVHRQWLMTVTDR